MVSEASWMQTSTARFLSAGWGAATFSSSGTGAGGPGYTAMDDAANPPDIALATSVTSFTKAK
eukprot:CAMPEP_0175628640 /NCGR_PEP_ID=MMETSP0096-20121207/72104_1 /TAXON_ID=311494 /ORGANISM="Alexandrium monilatum, Strain CCMP3105" /LENGTH=62 /DNA_ID=CAMNT_0016934045 /DNA_START=39 /DNA_END=224 /DNA_ORIENTATION=+